MIIGKNSLLVVGLTAKSIPILDCVRIEEDGMTIAGNGKSFVVISPTPEENKSKLSSIYNDEPSNGVTITGETTKEIVKNIPPDKRFGGLLEHVEIVSNDGNDVKITCYDGARKREIAGKVNPNKYPDYRSLYSRALSNKQSLKVIVDIKRLIPLLEVMAKVAGDAREDVPLYIEFTNDNEVILRIENPQKTQRCIGLVFSVKDASKFWLQSNKWEERLKNGKDSTVNSNSRTNNSRYVNNSSNKLHISTTGRSSNKKVGDISLAHIIEETCPKCGRFHLASDGKFKWCSCKEGCNYFQRIKQGAVR